MTPGRKRFARTLVALACLLLLSVGYAHAAIGRPNAMDRRVDLLPSMQLLTNPAMALVDPDRQIGARHLAEWLLPGWLFMIAAEVVVLAYFWQSGVAAMVRDRLRRGLQNESLVRFCFGALLALIAQLAALIPEFYTYRIDRVMGLTNQLLHTWTGGWLVNTLIAMVVTGLVVTGVLWLVDKTHQWYIYTILAIFAISFASAYTTPFTSSFFDHFKTVGNGHVAAVLKKEETQAGYSLPIVVQTRAWRSHVGVAAVEGLGPTERIVISDTLLTPATLGELRFVVAFELGHVANGDPTRLALLNAIFVILGAAIAVFIADRIGFRRDDDPVSRLALVGALLGCVYLFVAPIDNSILRRMALRADQFAVGLTFDRPSAVRAIVRATDQRMDEVCPSHLSEFFLNSRPSPGERIAAINGVKNTCP
jgi:Zn-dependent protease with chaperone function